MKKRDTFWTLWSHQNLLLFQVFRWHFFFFGWSKLLFAFLVYLILFWSKLAVYFPKQISCFPHFFSLKFEHTKHANRTYYGSCVIIIIIIYDNTTLFSKKKIYIIFFLVFGLVKCKLLYNLLEFAYYWIYTKRACSIREKKENNLRLKIMNLLNQPKVI